jgi:gamma-glutamylcyclotransferase (GGCT)/AIG2-like uncharacterized protein YtfP
MTKNINNNNNIDLFVYGVLMFAELRLALTGRDFATSPAALSGYRRYRVKAEQFPALLAQAGSVTNGLLLHDVDPDTRALFDLFEDVENDLFRKHSVEVKTGAIRRWCMSPVASSNVAICPACGIPGSSPVCS